MAEFAFSPYETVNSILPGYTRNPVRARSRDGRIERRHGRGGRRELRRHRPRQRHRQLDPRPVIPPGAGRHPLDDGADQPGGRRAAQPARRHRRTDGAHASPTPSTVFQVIAGEDPDDPVDRGRARPADPATTRSRSQRDGLKGARIGILRQAYERDTTDPEIVRRVHGRDRGPQARRRHHRRSGARELDSVRAAAGRRLVRRLQVRHQPLPGRAGRSRAGALARGDHPLAAVPSVDRVAARAAQEGPENGPDTPAARPTRTIATQFRAAVAQDDGRATSSTRSSTRRGAIRRA